MMKQIKKYIIDNNHKRPKVLLKSLNLKFGLRWTMGDIVKVKRELNLGSWYGCKNSGLDLDQAFEGEELLNSV